MFDFLAAHPEICPAKVKEPHYFNPDRNTRSLGEYLSLFESASTEKWLLEASPDYLSTPSAPFRIRELSPRAKAIVMIRDPVEQIRSLHDLRILLHREHSLDLATELQQDDVEARYWNLVRNGAHVRRLGGVFAPEDIHVVVHEDFRADNAAEYRGVLEFLEVDRSFLPRFRTVNATSEPRSPTIQRMLWRQGGVTRAVARAALPRRLRHAAFRHTSHLNRRPRVPSTVDPAVAAAIWNELETDVELLGAFLERDLIALWNAGRRRSAS